MPGAKRRALLAVLLLHHRDAVVSAERLIDELWGDDPPATAAKGLQVHVSELRRALGDGQPIVTRPTGYAIELAPGALDLDQFERHLDEARRLRAAGDLRAARGRPARRARAVPRGAAGRRRAARARGGGGRAAGRRPAGGARGPAGAGPAPRRARRRDPRAGGAGRPAPVPRAAARPPDARPVPSRPPGRRARRLPRRPERAWWRSWGSSRGPSCSGSKPRCWRRIPRSSSSRHRARLRARRPSPCPRAPPISSAAKPSWTPSPRCCATPACAS